MPIIMPVKGTRDFYPEEMSFRVWLYDKIRSVSTQFGYQEYDGPFLERLDLYAAKSGEELVKEQSFVFKDRGGEEVALRPELTPSLARMVATRSNILPRPIRWWSFGPFWRYERPQKGRSREFFQWNIDLMGIDSPQVDAEIATIAANFFRSVNLTPDTIRILVNDRRLVDSQMMRIGIPPARRSAVFRLIDRAERMPSQVWDETGLQIGLSNQQLSALKDALNDHDAWQESQSLPTFFETVGTMGAGQYIAYDPSVIRGLDYYTGIVYEARDVAGRFRAILGGGRYDNLVADVGGDPIPGSGFAMGDMVIELVLEEYGRKPQLQPNPAQVLVITFDQQSLQQSIRACTDLRTAGICAEWYPQADRLPRQLRYADKQHIPIAVILGPDEIRAGQVTIKDLLHRTQITVPYPEMSPRIEALLESTFEP